MSRHVYFTNVMCCLDCEQKEDVSNIAKYSSRDPRRQGNMNVHNVIENWLHFIGA